MGSYGINLYNTSGNLVVSSDYEGYSYEAQTTYAGSGWRTISHTLPKSYPVTNPPLIAVNGSGYCALMNMKNDTNNMINTVNFAVSDTVNITTISPTSNGPIVSGNYGMAVYGPDGSKKMFDSRNRQFIVKDVITVPFNGDTAYNFNITLSHAAANNPWYIINGLFCWMNWSSDPIYYFPFGQSFMGVKNISSTSCNVRWVYTTNSSGYYPGIWSQTNHGTIIVGELSN